MLVVAKSMVFREYFGNAGCDCGKVVEKKTSPLNSGNVNSCGCLLGKHAITHGKNIFLRI